MAGLHGRPLARGGRVGRIEQTSLHYFWGMDMELQDTLALVDPLMTPLDKGNGLADHD